MLRVEHVAVLAVLGSSSTALAVDTPEGTIRATQSVRASLQQRPGNRSIYRPVKIDWDTNLQREVLHAIGATADFGPHQDDHFYKARGGAHSVSADSESIVFMHETNAFTYHNGRARPYMNASPGQLQEAAAKAEAIMHRISVLRGDEYTLRRVDTTWVGSTRAPSFLTYVYAWYLAGAPVLGPLDMPKITVGTEGDVRHAYVPLVAAVAVGQPARSMDVDELLTAAETEVRSMSPRRTTPSSVRTFTAASASWLRIPSASGHVFIPHVTFTETATYGDGSIDQVVIHIPEDPQQFRQFNVHPSAVRSTIPSPEERARKLQERKAKE